MRAERTVFVGLARDSAPMLPSVLTNLEYMAGVFQKSAFLFIENSSRDDTRTILEHWCRNRADAEVLSPENSAASSLQRTVRLAALRNQLIAVVRSRFPDFDFLVIADCDDVNAAPVTEMAGFSRAIDFLLSDESHAGVFSNTLGGYYDMWALRHPERCPSDLWEATMDYALRHRANDQQAYEKTFMPRLFSLGPDERPMEVDSAFGGLGIYRLPRVLANEAAYEGYKLRSVIADSDNHEIGWQSCEHVTFHAGLRAQGGRLFVLPWLINAQVEGLSFPPSSWRFLVFDPATLSTLPRPSTSYSPEGRNRSCPCGSGRRYKHCHGLP